MSDTDTFLSTEAVKLRAEYGGTWGEHPDHPLCVWQYEASENYTRLGYWEWCAARIHNETIESEVE
jgi:hypothetical protein